MPKDIQLAQHICGEHLQYLNPPPQSLFWSFCWLYVVWDFIGTRDGNLVWDLLLCIL